MLLNAHRDAGAGFLHVIAGRLASVHDVSEAAAICAESSLRSSFDVSSCEISALPIARLFVRYASHTLWSSPISTPLPLSASMHPIHPDSDNLHVQYMQAQNSTLFLTSYQ